MQYHNTLSKANKIYSSDEATQARMRQKLDEAVTSVTGEVLLEAFNNVIKTDQNLLSIMNNYHQYHIIANHFPAFAGHMKLHEDALTKCDEAAKKFLQIYGDIFTQADDVTWNRALAYVADYKKRTTSETNDSIKRLCESKRLAATR